MDIINLKACLTNAGREELMIPYIDYTVAKYIFQIATWALEGRPQEGRQVFFCIQNAKDMRHNDLPAQIRCRIVPLTPEQLELSLTRGPFDSMLLPEHGFLYGDPNLQLSDFWKSRGSYEVCKEFSWEQWKLWFWVPFAKPLRLFGMDHHHAVLWDMKQILRPLGIRLDFTWLCDGRPPINEALPSEEPPFFNSNTLYKRPVDEPLDKEFKERILARNYDGVITSHSLITSYRLRDLGLPLYHVNSTRFGNEWIQDPNKHTKLVEVLQELLHQERLRVFHNNRGDQMYFRQFFKHTEPNQELYIPSLCESLHRLRKTSPKTPKFLIWDTRQVLLQRDASPFMKELYGKLKQAHGDLVDSQAILLAEKQEYLPEGYLDNYTAIIHIPYNISTMSIFQQTRANIPIWVPSKALLEKLWVDPKEPNEMSWTIFASGSETNASPLDHVRDPSIVKAWVSKADFYYPETMGCVCIFESIEDLVEKLTMTNYDEIISKNEVNQIDQRQEVISAWEQAFRSLREVASLKK